MARVASSPPQSRHDLELLHRQYLTAINPQRLQSLAERLGVDDAMAQQILNDETGTALAVACKGANIDRAVGLYFAKSSQVEE